MNVTPGEQLLVMWMVGFTMGAGLMGILLGLITRFVLMPNEELLAKYGYRRSEVP